MKLMKTRLALRSAAMILLILTLVGGLFLGVGRSLVTEHEEQRQRELLNGLLNTVDNAIRIAVFLGDKQLGGEVAAGLVQNLTVQAVTIKAGEKVLADKYSGAVSRAQADGAEPIRRSLVSPFNPDEIIGTVELLPNRQAIADAVNRSTRFATGFFLALLLTVALSIVLVVIILITRPIAQISGRLHGLQAETGEHLALPRGNAHDEIAALVNNVNAMIDHLASILATERQLRVERELEEKQVRAIVDNAETGFFVLDSEGIITSSNPAFRRLLSATRGDIAHKHLHIVDILGESGGQVERLIKKAMLTKGAQREDVKLEGAGGVRWLNVILTPVEDGQLQGVANDITERKLAHVEAEQQAVTDSLTGISNRLGFERKLQWLIETRQRYPEHCFALLMIDLDLFKQVNDTLGHLAGDQVLVDVSERLQAILRQTDFVARLGGDEFAVIVDGSDNREILAPIAEKIVSALNEPIPLESGQSVQVGASVGIASCGGQRSTASELLRDADRAMYDSKEQGRNTYRFFEAETN